MSAKSFAQLVKYPLFYIALAGVSFRIGWCAAHYVSDRMDNFDPDIGRGYVLLRRLSWRYVDERSSVSGCLRSLRWA
ncbi:hypothetical protein PROPHIT361_81 [Mycobacterium phage prophiT36-1]|nr:hypothetical protein PROPHIT361_81 [Mycobacterium phage prophiT36-1]